MRGFSDRLDDDVDGSAGWIRTLDSQWDAFAMFAQAQDDKLARSLFSGDAWCFNDKPFNSRSDKSSVYDLEQGHPASAYVSLSRSLSGGAVTRVTGGGEGDHHALRGYLRGFVGFEDEALAAPAIHYYGKGGVEPQMSHASVLFDRCVLSEPLPIHKALTCVRIHCEISNLKRGEI